jgi:hypothetical protein
LRVKKGRHIKDLREGDKVIQLHALLADAVLESLEVDHQGRRQLADRKLLLALLR